MSQHRVSQESTQTRALITRFGPPEVLELRDAPIPEPAAGEVLLKVLATTASFTDTMIRSGNYPGVRERPPFSPGYDLVAEVAALGPGVVGPQVGQRVADLTVIGANQEYVCRPAAGLVSVPDGLGDAQAVSLILSYLTAYQMLKRVAAVEPGQRVLVHAAGGAVGMALCQLGQVMDLDVVGTASAAKRDFVTGLGATLIDYKREDFRKRVTEMGGADAVFDAIGLNHFRRSFKTLRSGGALVAYGFYNATAGADSSRLPRLAAEFLGFQVARLYWQAHSNRRATFYNITTLRKQRPDWFKEDLSDLYDLAKEDKLSPLIWREMKLEQVRTAHQLIEAAEPQGKVVLRP